MDGVAHIMTKRKSSQCVATDGKMLTRACVINFDMGKVAYDQIVNPPSHITLIDCVTRCVDKLCSPFPLNRQFTFSAITTQALESITMTFPMYKHTFTHINAIDDPARSLTRVRPTHASACILMVHQHCMIFHYPRVPPLERGLVWRCVQVAWAYNPALRTGWA